MVRPAGVASLSLAIAAVIAGCGGTTSSAGTTSISERNAAARAAVAYDGGAGLVEALDRAGVPCIEQSVTPQMAAGAHVADNVTCTYAADDWVQVFMAAPSELGRAYFSTYFETFQESKSSVSAQSLTLEGTLWFATAPTDERLFATQAALGGQLLEP
jgi:hypothetical protein